jgi:zinc and cadmium transporter
VPLIVRLTHTRMQLALSFVAGVILGIGLLHLLPHGYMQLRNIDQAASWTLGGFLAMFFLEWYFQYHHHDAPADKPHSHAPHDPPHPKLTSPLSWTGALVGLALHGLIDGIAVAAALEVESSEGHGAGLAGLGTFLAVLLHKPFDSLMIGTLLAASGASRARRHTINAIYACVAPLGIFAFFVGLSQWQATHPDLVGHTLCFAAGAFLCIASSDLLPEIQTHSHDRLKLSLSLLAGIALAAAIVLVETSGHEHHEPHENAAAVEPAGGPR